MTKMAKENSSGVVLTDVVDTARTTKVVEVSTRGAAALQ